MSSIEERPQVYVVEDDDTLRSTLSKLLTTAGYRVRGSASGREFLDTFDPSTNGCIVLDLKMPGMSGDDVQEELERLGSRTPVIVISGYGDVPTAVRVLKRGAVEFLEKPFKAAELFRAIDDALTKDRMSRDKGRQAEDVVNRTRLLTKRQREVLDLIVQGKTSKEIGSALGISPRTVEVHRRRVNQTMGADSLADLVKITLRSQEGDSP